MDADPKPRSHRPKKILQKMSADLSDLAVGDLIILGDLHDPVFEHGRRLFQEAPMHSVVGILTGGRRRLFWRWKHDNSIFE